MKNLQIKLSWGESGNNAAEKINEIEKEKRKEKETLPEAWVRILSMNNTTIDAERLKTVKGAMDAGEIGREPVAPGKKVKQFSKAEALRLYQAFAKKNKKNKLRELVEKMPANYKLITTHIEFDHFLEKLALEPIVAIDTETTGLNVYEDVIVGISFTLPIADLHVYIPIRHKDRHNEVIQLTPKYVLTELKPYLESNEIKKVLHNAKYDAHMFRSAGINFGGIGWDTQISMHVLNENEPSFALKNLATKYLKEPSDTFSELFGKTRFDDVPLDVALAYAAKDTDVTWRLYQFQLKHLQKQPDLLRLLEEIEIPLINVVVDMEREGFVIDTEAAKVVEKTLTREIAVASEKLRQHFGDLNFSSPLQLSEILFKKLKLNKHLPKNYKLSTDVKTLKLLKPYNEGVASLLEYREKTKLLGTYVETLPKQVGRDGRLHGQFNQMGTVTGRFSSQNPNLQNQPKNIRPFFKAPDGLIIISGDFSQQEPRILAHFTGEPALVEAYKRGQDLYAFMASRVYKLPYEQCTGGAPQRKAMKFGVLSVMYGTGSKTLAGQLSVSVAEAEKFISDFFKEFPLVDAWIKENQRQARSQGFVTTLHGRKRRLPDAKSRDKWVRLRAERQGTNSKVQGSGSEQTKITMLALSKWFKKKRTEGRYFSILGTIHDEILSYAPADITIEERNEFERIMVESMMLKVPNKTDVEYHINWGVSSVLDRSVNKYTQYFVAKDKKDKTTHQLQYFDSAHAACVAVGNYLIGNKHMKIDD